ncbi:unnamed protein product [Polarella glacialis]|uniref:Uncharacterized protein n=1 Tax=Polarella glacialis TaxID=89957 RepID=A0A813HXK7_POLGL|nr:unnamed protein product [Polarella glacialis]
MAPTTTAGDHHTIDRTHRSDKKTSCTGLNNKTKQNNNNNNNDDNSNSKTATAKQQQQKKQQQQERQQQPTTATTRQHPTTDATADPRPQETNTTKTHNKANNLTGYLSSRKRSVNVGSSSVCQKQQQEPTTKI